jgi:hypothetical protein
MRFESVKAHFSEYLNSVLGTPQHPWGWAWFAPARLGADMGVFLRNESRNLEKRNFQFSRFSATAVEATEICE